MTIWRGAFNLAVWSVVATVVDIAKYLPPDTGFPKILSGDLSSFAGAREFIFFFIGSSVVGLIALAGVNRPTVGSFWRRTLSFIFDDAASLLQTVASIGFIITGLRAGTAHVAALAAGFEILAFFAIFFAARIRR
nr:hypothetical protein [Luteibacter rhizovicinus]